ncbi:hypothetical protein OF001_U80028 [Pseudomonas sp. OF001]|nr:hypothetical protein OF001_U80028 [Pseudomonas sp. OF001]
MLIPAARGSPPQSEPIIYAGCRHTHRHTEPMLEALKRPPEYAKCAGVFVNSRGYASE